MSSAAVAPYNPNEVSPGLEAPSPMATGQAPPLFSPDTDADDHAGRAATASFLAQLVTSPGAGTPFLIALFGSAGSGKSALLRRILGTVQEQSGNSRSDPSRGGFPVLGVRIDASSGDVAETTLMGRVFAALSHAYPSLAEDVAFAGSDPLKAARAAGERANDLRRQLDSERQALDELGGRRARLAETVLFDSPGSRVDVYARANRARIEAQLRGFGVAGPDPIASYKHFVREAAESGGASQVGLVLRTLWGFKGQGALIVMAILLLCIGWASAALANNQDAWLAWLTGFGDHFTGLTNWARDHSGWLSAISHAAYSLGFVAILVDIVRAIRFLQPVLKGATLLAGDLDGRRHDLDSLLAHQSRRVDHLVTEVESAARASEKAERRVDARRAAGLLDPTPSPADSELAAPVSPRDTAQAFFSGLGAAMAAAAQRPSPTPAVNHQASPPGGIDPSPSPSAPRRIVVAIDELDRLPPAEAGAYLEVAHQLLARANFVILAAVDRSHILAGFSDTDPALAAARLDRYVQLTYDLDADAALAQGSAGTQAESTQAASQAQSRGSDIDLPWQAFETPLVQALAAFAGPNPRSTKRFINSYRVARADPRLTDARPAELAALACALALDRSGSAADLGGYRDSAPVNEAAVQPGAHIARALAAAQQAIGSSFTPADARRGLQVARIYSRRG